MQSAEAKTGLLGNGNRRKRPKHTYSLAPSGCPDDGSAIPAQCMGCIGDGCSDLNALHRPLGPAPVVTPNVVMKPVALASAQSNSRAARSNTRQLLSWQTTDLFGAPTSAEPKFGNKAAITT